MSPDEAEGKKTALNEHRSFQNLHQNKTTDRSGANVAKMFGFEFC